MFYMLMEWTKYFEPITHYDLSNKQSRIITLLTSTKIFKCINYINVDFIAELLYWIEVSYTVYLIKWPVSAFCDDKVRY